MKKVSLAAIFADFLKPLTCLGALGFFALLTASVWHNTGKNSTAPMPNLTGDKAKDYTNEQGTQRSLSEAIQAARYSVNWVKHAPIPNESGAFQAHNPGQGYSTYFAKNEVSLVHRSEGEKWRVSFKLMGIDYDSVQRSLGLGEWSANQTRISASHQINTAIGTFQSTITEWYENKPEGLEQGFTIDARPDLKSRTANSQLRLVFQIEGELQPHLDSDQQAVSFVRETHSATHLRYGNLKATDTNGKQLASRMELQSDQLSLVVDDHDAVYPVTIDPLFTQTKKVTAPDPGQSAAFGSGVDLDGDTLVVGAASGLANQAGSAYIFERNQGGADNWSLVKELLAPDGVFGDGFGWSVAISKDTVMIGANRKKIGFNTQQGTVYIYERNSGGPNNWGLVKELTASDAEVNDNFGWALDVDGDSAIVGMANHFSNNEITTCAAYIFDRNAGGPNNWGEVKRITRTDNQDDWGGYSVGISGDTALIGAPKHFNLTTNTIGSAYVVERNEGGPNNWGIVKKLNSGLLFVNNTFFGIAVSIDSDRLVVGAGNENIPGETTENAAYVFDRNEAGSNNWGLVKKVVASDDVSGNAFALSLAIRGDTLVVGARGAPIGTNTQRGAAYVYKQNTGGADNWGQEKKVIAADGASGDLFGWSVALDGKTLVVGAPLDTVATIGQGSVYLFKSENDVWIQEVKPLPAGCTVDDAFGFSVSLSGDTAVVGTLAADVGSNANQGVAYIFERHQGGTDNWGLVKTLTAPDGTKDDKFGLGVAISNDTVVVGAPFADVGGHSNQGAAYIFQRNAGGPNNWGLIKKIAAADGTANNLFGAGIDISNDTVVGGVSSSRGAAYVFEKNVGGTNNWGEVKKLQASDGAAGDRFGIVAIDGDTIVVGADLDDVGVNVDQGSAYVFDRNNGGSNNWGEVRKLVAPNGAANDHLGRVDISGDNVILAGIAPVGGNIAQGYAYIFSRHTGGANNWGPVKKLTASDGKAFDWFTVVAINGNTAIVGALFSSNGPNQSYGAAYIFKQNAGGTNNWGEVKNLKAPNGPGHDNFGAAVAISGPTAIIGVASDDVEGAANLGSVYVFESQNDTWPQQKRLVPPLPTNCGTGDGYGSSVAIDGDTVVIGARGDDVGLNTDQGSAYILERNQGGPNHWGVVRVLTAPDGASHTTSGGFTYGDGFGYSVAISGDTIVVGSFQAMIGTNEIQGAAYIFERNEGGPNNWGQVKKLTASDGLAFSNFGGAVSIDHNTILIGSYSDDVNGNNARGSAYLFERNLGGAENWGELKKLTASDGAALDIFGGSVSLSGDTAVVGAFGQDAPNSSQGSAYVFERSAGGQNNWGETKKLTASDGDVDDFFGFRVALSGNTLIIGAYGNDIGANVDQGGAYIFGRNAGGANNWGEVTRLVAADGAADDFFGFAVGVSGDTAIVGAFQDDVGQNVNQGSVYIFDQNKNGPDRWGQVQRLGAAEGSAGDGFGRAVGISDDDLIIGANITELPPTSNLKLSAQSIAGNTQGFAYVFRGVASDSTPVNGIVSGHIATANGNPVAGVLVRLTGTQNRLSVTDTQGNYRFDNVPTSGAYTVTPSLLTFTFSPPERSFNQLAEQTVADFTAVSGGGMLNPIDATAFFVRQQYIDFLNREPDEPGLNFWINNIERCGADQNCREVQRINTSAAFFLSIEFQNTGYLVYRTYQTAYGDMPNAPVPLRLSEFLPDTQQIGANVIVNQTGWEQQLESNKQAYMAAFVQRARFGTAYPITLSPTEFVDKLFMTAGVTPSSSERTLAINEFGSATSSADTAARGRALRRVAENSVLAQQEFDSAFVLMQYFGYLRRDPNSGPDTDFSGYNFWLTKLRSFHGDFQNAEMVKAFLVSGEYRHRFGP